jgi:hypothetical protein
MTVFESKNPKSVPEEAESLSPSVPPAIIVYAGRPPTELVVPFVDFGLFHA